MRHVTLGFLLRDTSEGREVCLAVKRGNKHVAGYLNGSGGKRKRHESLLETTSREAKEELGIEVSPSDWQKVTVVDFIFPNGKWMDLRCFVFTTQKWSNEPQETDAMGLPRWYPIDDLPYSKLPPSDRLWLLPALHNRLEKAVLYLDNAFKVESYELRYRPMSP